MLMINWSDILNNVIYFSMNEFGCPNFFFKS